MIYMSGTTWRTLRAFIIGGVTLCAIAGPAQSGERHAGTVLNVDSARGQLVLDEFGVAATRKTVALRVAPQASIVDSQRREPVESFDRPFIDTPIALADVQVGDFVVVDVERPGIAQRVTITRQATGS